MWQRSMLRIAIATAIYGALHSALATLFAKQRAALLFGDRNRNGLYRVLYIAQSFVTISLLMAYAWPLPHRQLYRIEGPLAKAMHAGEAAALVYATWAASQVGIRRITGLGNVAAWLTGRRIEPEPEAQGPPSISKAAETASARSPSAAIPSTSSRSLSFGFGRA